MKRYGLFVIACVLAAQPASGQTAGSSVDVSTDADALESAAETIARMKTSMKQVVDKVEEARNAKDFVKLNCVNEKLTQIKGLLRMSEQADIALHEAVANRDPGAEAELAKIAIARTKVETLRAEAEQCIGQLAYMVDEKTNVEVEQPSDLPTGGDALSLRVADRTDLLAQVMSGSLLLDPTMTGLETVPGAGPPPGPPAGRFPFDFIPPPPVVPPDVSPWGRR